MRNLLGKLRNIIARRVAGPGNWYRVYTRDFDRTVQAEELHSVLGQLSDEDQSFFEQAWLRYAEALKNWRSEKLVSGIYVESHIFGALSAADRSNIVVTLLIDHSGSMRGERILMAALAAEVARSFILSLGAKVEILGFTTVGWQGGQSRKRWKRRWKLPGPGRLCDLLHIVYMDADDRNSAVGSDALKPMLRPDLLKENVDGEAVEWAITRLRARPEKRKILLVLSDGAPVDDSTLYSNGTNYLHFHLKEVVAAAEASDDIELAAVGLGPDFRSGRYYSRSKAVLEADELGAVMIAFLKEQLVRLE